MNMLLVGDVMLGRFVNETLKHTAPEYPWGDTLPLFRAADFRACNLECVISDRGRPWSMPPKAFHFRSDSKNVAVLKAAGIDTVSTANNHALDYEWDALVHMLDVLDAAEIRHAGAGRNLASARTPAICVVRGERIGLLAFSDNEPNWEATDRLPGIYYLPIDLGDGRAKDLLTQVALAKTVVDYLIVSVHWGPNLGYRPQPPHIPFARALVDAGADLIFGHSGHVFQGVDVYQGCPIVFCAGDFVDDYAVDELERNDQSFIFSVETQHGEARRLRMFPTVIRQCQARRARGNEAEQIAAKMRELCAEFGVLAHPAAEGEGSLEIDVPSSRGSEEGAP